MQEPRPSERRRSVVGWWIEFVLSHHRAVLAISLVSTLCAASLASRLVLDPNLRRLLPPDDPVVAELREQDETLGTTSAVTVLLEGGTLEGRRAFSDAAARRLATSALIREVRHRVDADYFSDHALYYLDDQRFGELAEHLAAWRHYEFCSRASSACLTDPDPGAEAALKRFIDERRAELEQSRRFVRYFEDDEAAVLAFFVRPYASPHDFEEGAKIEALFADVFADLNASTAAAAWRDTNMRISLLGGHVVNPVEQRILVRDVGLAGALGVTGVLIVLWTVFRSARAMVLLVVPLVCGLAWALGAAQLLVGHLNALTAMISSVIVGMGIDSGIHLLARARSSPDRSEPDRSIHDAYAELTAPLLVASITTLGAFGIIATSSYPLFFEFGLVAGLGVFTCLTAMLTVFPALLKAIGIPPASRRDGTRVETDAGAGNATSRRVGVTALVLAIAATAVGLGAVDEPRFERDGRKIQSDSLRPERLRALQVVKDLFDTTPFPAALRVQGYDRYEALYHRIQRTHAASREREVPSMISEVVGLPAFMPPSDVDSAARHEAVLELGEDFDDETWTRLVEAARVQDPGAAEIDEGEVSRLRRMLSAEPVAIDALPPSIRDRFRSSDGLWVLFAYPNFDAADILDSVAFDHELRRLVTDEPRPFVGEPIVLSTMFESLRVESPRIIALASVLAVALVLLQVRSLAWTILSLVPLALGIALMIAIMPWFGVRLTLLNVPVVPAIVGIGVDNGVYAVAAMRLAGTHAERLARVAHTSRTIAASCATTVAGFAALMIADSGGVQSIGALATLGLSCTAFVALALMAAIRSPG